MIEIYKNIIKKHSAAIFLYFLSVVTIFLLTTTVIYSAHLNYISNQLENNIEEYNEIDLEQLCKLSQCKQIISNGYVYTITENELETSHVHYQEDIDTGFVHLYKEPIFAIGIHEPKSDAIFILNNDNFVNNLQWVSIIIIPLSFLFFIVALGLSVKHEKELMLANIAGNEALLMNKSMIMITENIHHELNTPLEVIDNKIDKIHGAIEHYLIKEYEYYLENSDIPENEQLSRYEYEKSEKRAINKQLVKLTEDFDFIKVSSEQIYNILEKMKGFKHLRYSNGNKSIKNIIDGAFKMVQISNTNYEYDVSKRLEDFTLKPGTLKNADVLNVFINHIKNSLEANANQVLVLLSKIEDEFIKVRIIDNGNGIKETNIKDIFKPNFSTKEGTGIRGNGMYLNQHLLKLGGGSVRVVNSTPSGTTIELILPVTPRI